MRGTPTDYWGKVQFDATGCPTAWHPLWHHCADVAACAQVLLDESLLGRRLATAAGLKALDPTLRERLVALAAAHDLGKLNRGFRARGLREGASGAGHVDEAIALLKAPPRGLGFEALIEPMLAWGPGFGPLLIASICHHGRPRYNEADGAALRAWWQPEGDVVPGDGLRTLWSHLRTWCPRAWAPGGALPESPAFAHAFSGLVMLADWLGSDTRLFPYAEADQSPAARFEWAIERAKTALKAVGTTPAALRAGLSPESIGIGHLGSGFTQARPLQQAILDRPGEPSAGSTLVLEAETGSGKTEAALLHFLRLFAAGQVDGLYFALPTRTSAVQIHRRVHQAIETAFGAQAPGTVLAVPGYLRVDDVEGERAGRFQVDWSPLAEPDHLWSDDAHAQRQWRFWAAEHAKRYLAGAVVVGTVDQALLSGLQVRHAHLRAVALSRLLLVVDEVHASDTYMTQILSNVLRRHRAQGGHALLLSATLGGEARARLLGHRALPGLAAGQATPYPAISSDHAPAPAPIVRDDTQAKRVDVELWPNTNAEAVAERALRAAAQGARVLIIRNTVRGCVAVQQALVARHNTTPVLRVGGQPAPHHARFAPADRRRLDSAIEAAFGKHAPAEGGVVAVATQTVEQSLDLDADLLLTDLAPMDVLLQRIGRLHRHRGRDAHRPAGYTTARCVVLDPGALEPRADGELRAGNGLGTVYADGRVLEATRRSLADAPQMTIPAENRARVEAAVHSEVTTRIEAESAAWSQHGRTLRGQDLSARLAAQMNLLDEREPYLESRFPSDRQISARLGVPALCFRLPEGPIEGPLGAISEIRVPAWQLPDAFGPPEDASVSIAKASDGLRIQLKGLSTLRLHYSALGLHEDT